MKRDTKAAIDKVRQHHGLAYTEPLIPATCSKCKRTYYHRVVPEICPWPTCGERLK